jgi:hypothetical protein
VNIPARFDKTTGRLRWVASLTRHAELRWVGPGIQWVLSPVQVALWTDNRNRRQEQHPGLPYNWRLNWCPLGRDYPQGDTPPPA